MSEEDLVKQLRARLKEQEAKAKRADQLEEELARYKADDRFRDAGLDHLNDHQRDAVEALLEDPDDHNQLRAMADQLGFQAPDVAALARMQQTAAGAVAGAGWDVTSRIRDARTPDEVLALIGQPDDQTFVS